MKHMGMYLLAAAMGALVSQAATAQGYPVKSVQVIVPFAPGGSTDIIGRAMAQKLSEAWKQPVLVDNRPSAGSIIGTDMVAKAAPDGYTLLSTATIYATAIALYGDKLPFNPYTDLTPITLINTTPLVLAVPSSLPVKSLKELIALAKSKPDGMNFASSSIGGVNHLSGELLALMSGTKMTHIPYKGNAPAILDLVAGRVEFGFNGTTSVLPMIQAGKLRPIAVSSRTRSSVLPDVPTLDESGLKGFDAAGWNILFAPAKTPRAIIVKINTDAVKAVHSPELLQRLKDDGSEARGTTPEEVTAYIREEAEKWIKVVKAGNIRPE